MKRRRQIGALALAAALLLAGCGQRMPAPEPNERELKEDPANFLGLTAEQKQEDFDYTCKVLELYPIRQDLEQAQAVRFSSTLKRYRSIALESESDLAFLSAMRQMFSALGNRGHLSLYTPQTYQDTRELYALLDNQVKLAILDNDASRATYEKLDVSATGQFVLRQTGEENAGAGNSSGGSRGAVEVKKLDGTTAYVRIPTFNGLVMEENGPKVAQFIEACAEDATEDLIIDIRGNGGGNANYWRKYIVAPNITEAKTVVMQYLFGDDLLESAEARSQLMAEHPDIQQIKQPIEELPPYAQTADRAERFAYFVRNESSISPAPAEHPFTGRFWLLVDGGNGSASEMFVDYCQQTGFATTVGEMTSGANCFGEPYLFAMPNSGLIFRFDPFYGLNPDGSCNNIHGVRAEIPCASKDALEVCLAEISK